MSTFVGRPLPRREDDRLLRGRGRYLDDLAIAGAVDVAFVRSPHASARVRGVRVPDEAPGLVAVLVAGDLDGLAGPLPIQPVEGAELADAPQPLLARDEVRYAGQPVAAVVAESRALAEDAADLVEVDYEPLEPVLDAGSAPERLLHFTGREGDAESAFAAAAHVVRRTYEIPRVIAAPMENRGIVADWDPDGERLTAWISAQDPHRPLAQLAHALSLRPEAIHVIVPDVGGAFGSKGALAPEEVVAAAAAMRLGRPVRWIEDRLENLVVGYQGRGMRGDVALALDAGGRLLAVRARLVADLGAYLQPSGGIPPHTTAMLMAGVYDVPVADVELVGARTNKVPTGPYRGAGRPEAAFLLERTIDEAARELGLAPAALRRRNLVRRFPHRSPLGWSYDSGDYERCLDRALELVADAREPGSSPSIAVGTGVAMYVERGGGLWETAEVVVEPSGRVVIASGSNPHGQGHDTTFAQIAADRLGVGLDDIVLRFGDSDVVPRGIGTFASRSVAMGGSAIAVAADEIVERAREIAGGDRSLSLADVAARAGGLSASARFSSDLVFSSGAYAAVVEIERATGVLRVRRIVAVDDAGHIINPLLAEGQVLGGTIQGLGTVTSEEAALDAAGRPLGTSLLAYSLLTAAEQPPIVTDFVTSPSPRNPLGAKGIGEGGAIGTPAAIGNAVADALGGRHVDPPYTAEKLWRALG